MIGNDEGGGKENNSAEIRRYTSFQRRGAVIDMARLENMR